MPAATDATAFDRARNAKPRAAAAARRCAPVVGVGITRLGGQVAVKVNLAAPAERPSDLPEAVDGVPVVYEVVGRIAPRRRPGDAG